VTKNKAAQKPPPVPPPAAPTPPAPTPRPYRIPFDVVSGTFMGCAIHIELVQRGKGGVAVAIDPKLPITVEVESPAHAAQAVFIHPPRVAADLRHVDLRVYPGPAFFQGVPPWPSPPAVTLRVEASLLLPPLPGVPVDVGRALPPVEGRCGVDLHRFFGPAYA
jgi:hypothetical protein